MIEFILAGILYLGVMLAVVFGFSFITIAVTYICAACVRRALHWFRQPECAVPGQRF